MPTGTIAKAFFSLVFDKVCCHGKDNGLGSGYNWANSLDAGLQTALQNKKPLMVIIHKSWCTACKKIKPRIATSEEIKELSQWFVMVNLVDDEEPLTHAYSPDGKYIPRIFFLSPTGRVDHDIYNEEGDRDAKYFYNKPAQIVKSMKRALSKYKN